MSETVERRERVPVHTRIDRQAFETIERLAEQRRIAADMASASQNVRFRG